MKASDVSNVGNMATGSKIADLSLGQETVTSPNFAILSQEFSFNNLTGTQ